MIPVDHWIHEIVRERWMLKHGRLGRYQVIELGLQLLLLSFVKRGRVHSLVGWVLRARKAMSATCVVVLSFAS